MKKRTKQIKPGLTGWAQINGRDEISLEHKVALEKEYLEQKSFWFDMKIIVMTFTKILTSKGGSALILSPAPVKTGQAISEERETIWSRKK